MSEAIRIIVDDQPVPARDGDSVLVALLRHGRWPTGCLCGAGDCPNCLATVDGVSYVRMCQAPARPGSVVVPFAVQEHPPLPRGGHDPDTPRRFVHTEVVVAGGGRSGTAEAALLEAEGRRVVVVDAARGEVVLALYPGPTVVARVAGELVRIAAEEIVVATGRSEIQPVVEGSGLAGILTRRAAEAFAAAGVDLGSVVALGSRPAGIDCTVAEGTLVRFEGEGHVEALVVADEDGVETVHTCDTAVVDLGTYPRSILARMARSDEVRMVGGMAERETIPSCPKAGTVCPCSEVTISDLDFVWERGFREIELIKRATLAGTGTCQGSVCTPYLRAFVAHRGGNLQPTFTARPPDRQLTIGEAAAGYRLPAVHRTALDATHRSLGARMDRIGGWYRPWVYPDTDREYWAVREAVSVCDVGTLGKMIVRGPDVAAFLERLYPCHVADIRPGRSRYALVLAESGGLMDDGLICRVDETTFHLTFTSGGASHAEAWVRDWTTTFDADVRIMDRTHSLGAINVTGPLATELLTRAGMDEPLPFMSHAPRTVAGVPCHVYRLSFTGEASYELHHPIRQSVELWESLMALGENLGIAPHGLQTLQTLRLEKGHVIIGMDTEPDSTPRSLGMDWAVRMGKPDFVGRAALSRIDAFPPRKRLVGLTLDGHPPTDGTPVYQDGEISGYVTSAAWSPVLGRAVMLAWVKLRDGVVPETVFVGNRQADNVPTPFYDPEGARARA